jgi:hypothetical protein
MARSIFDLKVNEIFIEVCSNEFTYNKFALRINLYIFKSNKAEKLEILNSRKQNM